MKKFFSLILLTTLALNVFLTSISAEQDRLTQKEAETLVAEAYTMIYFLQHSRTSNERDYFTQSYKEIETISAIDLYNVHFNPAAYRMVTEIAIDERFDTIEKCYEFVEKIFTHSCADKIIKHGFGEDRPIFISTTGLQAYAFPTNQEVETKIDNKVLYTGGLSLDNMGSWIEKLDSVGSVNVNGNTASIKVTSNLVFYVDSDGIIYHYSNTGDMYMKNVPFEFDIEFEKTNSGWKVSGGSYIDFLTLRKKIAGFNYFPEEYPGIPSTGDSSPAVVGLALAALVSLAAPFVVKRRRAR